MRVILLGAPGEEDSGSVIMEKKYVCSANLHWHYAACTVKLAPAGCWHKDHIMDAGKLN